MASDRSSLGGRVYLTPFVAGLEPGPPRRDQRDLMEQPFFSLAKAKRVKPILYRAGATEVEVYAVAEHGMATIWDADVLIWAASQLLAADDRGVAVSRLIRFTPYQLLGAIGRATGNREYRLLVGALTRLQSTVVRTSVRQGEHWRRHQFSWIAEWEALTTAAGRAEGMEMVLSEWVFRGVLDRKLVLSIDPAYFTLTGGIERWLYRVARKHAGRQPGGWRFELRHLHAKSGSLARYSDFALDVRRIAARQPLPGYAVTLKRDDRGRDMAWLRPTTFDWPVDNLWAKSGGVGTSGAPGIGTSGASVSGFRAQDGPQSPSTTSGCGAPKPSKQGESNFLVGGAPRQGMGRSPC